MSSAQSQAKALISVFYKEGLAELAAALQSAGYGFISTGGTRSQLETLGYSVEAVEDLTSYPSILGGRVKTLHPKVFGGILSRKEESADQATMREYELPSIEVVVVDLYPFEETLASGAAHDEIIEKIDIGGISLIRAAAKNYQDCWVIPSRAHYAEASAILQKGGPSLKDRQRFAAEAFALSSHYDQQIQDYLRPEGSAQHNIPLGPARVLRYGENPHQKGIFYGDLEEVVSQLQGKELSYNNLLDVDAAVKLIQEFDQTTVAVLKHNNACGVASRAELKEAWEAALAGDPVSAFGGVIVSNRSIDLATAEAMNAIFFEVVIAPDYEDGALSLLASKKNRIILKLKPFNAPSMQYRSLLNGILAQEPDHHTDGKEDLKTVTKKAPDSGEEADLLFASKICKHTKSNTIILAKDQQLLAGGTGQTSRVDALKQAIEKAKAFEFALEGAVMASDAFFPFPDCVEIADLAGIAAVIQPGGSIKDQLSIDYCDAHDMSMVFTGVRHFRH